MIDSSDGVVEAVNYSLREMGEPEQPPDKIKPFIGYSLTHMYPHFTDAPMGELRRLFQIQAKRSMVASTVVLPGVEEVLKRLHEAEYGLAIASTKIIIHISGILAKFGWESIFEVFSGGDEVAQVKPDPEIFRLTLERLEANPGQAVVVGDTVNDVLAALSVPVSVVAVASPYGGEDKVRQAGPDHFLEHVEELPDLLTSIFEKKSKS
ncbi:MAG: HAD family hydrolase [candidate division Zixibacteria bacterium]|nr:HAD family hydrolase [candidate division Zixibacteria bacterium]